ncbi:hypothetical protein PVAP13_7KG374501 [Panicum virgatum]|uniref:Uncharacterized protein n=1 Tax=Panicum virgatum TaxID=38727 RepID=A0A8T0QRX1_PANVG|nr:hypothetical protein PVAP13_7KG374501 [Panicum virgatum]
MRRAEQSELERIHLHLHTPTAQRLSSIFNRRALQPRAFVNSKIFEPNHLSLSLSLSSSSSCACLPSPPHRTAPGPAPTRQLRFPSPSSLSLHLDRAPNPKAHPHSLHPPLSRPSPPRHPERRLRPWWRRPPHPPGSGGGGGGRVCPWNREGSGGSVYGRFVLGAGAARDPGRKARGVSGWRRAVGVI